MKNTFTTKSPKPITTKEQFKQHFFISQWARLAQCSFPGQRHLKLLELLLGSSSFCHFEHVEPHGFAEWSALSNSHNISNCDISAEGRKVGSVIGTAEFQTRTTLEMRSCIRVCQRQCRQSILSLEDHREKDITCSKFNHNLPRLNHRISKGSP